MKMKSQQKLLEEHYTRRRSSSGHRAALYYRISNQECWKPASNSMSVLLMSKGQGREENHDPQAAVRLKKKSGQISNQTQ